MSGLNSPPPAPHPPAPNGPYSRFSPGQPIYNQGAHPPGSAGLAPRPGAFPPGSGPPSALGPPGSATSQRPFSAGPPPGTPGPPSGGQRPTIPQSGPLPPHSAGAAQYPPGVGLPPPGRKRLIVCCDGTWLNSDHALRRGQLELPSNVTRISRAIKAQSSDGIAQVVYYLQGVGSEGGILTRVVGGATAKGLGENIREGYAFIANNYNPGDEIFLLGFSRGAFTARSIAGLMDGVGLLTKAGLASWGVIFEDAEHRYDPHYNSAYPNVPFPNKPSVNDPRYCAELSRRGLTRLHVPVKAVAVWDTVGSLGVPRVPWLEGLRLVPRALQSYKFYDTALSDLVENAFQALALDEQRAAFSPTLWEKKSPRNRTNLRQVWFPGVHSNVGGGSYADLDLANITLAWMIAQLEVFIDFNPDYVREQFAAAQDYYKQSGQGPRPWSFGEIYNSMTGIYGLGGRAVRTPGMYKRTDPLTQRATGKSLRDTYEYIHPSARSRRELDGPGVQDRGSYDPPALRDYRLRATGSTPGDGKPLATWESRSKRKGQPKRILNESPLWETELKLLRYSGKVYDFLLDEPRHQRRSGGGRERGRGTVDEEPDEDE